MLLLDRLTVLLTSLLNILTPNPLRDDTAQQVLRNDPNSFTGLPKVAQADIAAGLAAPSPEAERDYAYFRPPGASITCDYSAMGSDWVGCNTKDNRNCWLKNKVTGKRYDIFTDYENFKPVGVKREYQIILTEDHYDADGVNFPYAKLFALYEPEIAPKRQSYPGPWIEACWGDTISVKVINGLKTNGTSVHWHGIRQWGTPEMDGVNGVTQCPIRPDDAFTYTFETWQYGSSWYHSHYGVQYADGAVGPLTIHGPASTEYDEAIEPLILTDWGHNSAFNAVLPGNDLLDRDLLVNGRGNATLFNNTKADINKDKVKPLLDFVVDPPKTGEANKKYLMRIINTSFDTTFRVSIDNHWIQVISADFVPISPYRTTDILVGIGQRYNVIIEAKPVTDDSPGTPYNPLPTGKDATNFWVRTFVTPGCFQKNSVKPSKYYEAMAVLRYDAKNLDRPTSTAWEVSTACKDETYGDLHPIVPWVVGKPPKGENNTGQLFDTNSPFGRFPPKRDYLLAFWSLGRNGSTPDPALRVDYSKPTIVEMMTKDQFNASQRVVVKQYQQDQWIYLAINSYVAHSHPIHLHGHDFALLEQSPEGAIFNDTIWVPTTRINPPRRDVVLLPSEGYIVIAFKADNPGPWLLHCHIAVHISEGLGFQIMENQKEAKELMKKRPEVTKELDRVCKNWNEWVANPKNWAKRDCSKLGGPSSPLCFQNDSGV